MGTECHRSADMGGAGAVSVATASTVLKARDRERLEINALLVIPFLRCAWAPDPLPGASGACGCVVPSAGATSRGLGGSMIVQSNLPVALKCCQLMGVSGSGNRTGEKKTRLWKSLLKPWMFSLLLKPPARSSLPPGGLAGSVTEMEVKASP